MGDGREQETDLKETDRHRKWKREEGKERELGGNKKREVVGESSYKQIKD